MKRKSLSALLCMTLAASMLVAGCGGEKAPDNSKAPSDTQTPEGSGAADGEETGGEEAGGEEAGDISGVTLVFAQDLASDEAANAITNEILADYQEKTGVTIQFESQPKDYRVWLTTQFTANQGPDVYSGILYDMTTDYDAGYLYNFADLYGQESAYDPGKPWKDTLPESISERMYLTESDVPGYPSSTSVVRIFYNKNLFDKAGATVPKTWDEFMDVCEMLKMAGITPFGFPNASKEDLSWLWFNNSVCSQLNPDMVAALDVSGNGYVELNEIVKGFDEGTLTFTSDNMKQAYDLMKEFSQYWTSDYNGLDQESAIDMFIRGEVAMVQAMSTNLAGIETNVGDSFEFGVMPIPVITKETSEFAMGQSVILGGQPDIIYGINKALESDPTKLAAAIDFVQYMSSPEVQTKYMDAINRIPLATSTQLPERLAGFIITEDALRIPYYTGISGELRDFFCRGGQLYLEGSYDTDGFAQYVQESFATVLETIKAENEWSADNNYGL
ncbi:MAG: extracellular solute-binding protein [Lachnospiraceae bacterium]|nr:extracellular solute-binding protein [Lachnospiraceae bacterium]